MLGVGSPVWVRGWIARPWTGGEAQGCVFGSRVVELARGVRTAQETVY